MRPVWFALPDYGRVHDTVSAWLKVNSALHLYGSSSVIYSGKSVQVGPTSQHLCAGQRRPIPQRQWCIPSVSDVPLFHKNFLNFGKISRALTIFHQKLNFGFGKISFLNHSLEILKFPLLPQNFRTFPQYFEKKFVLPVL